MRTDSAVAPAGKPPAGPRTSPHFSASEISSPVPAPGVLHGGAFMVGSLSLGESLVAAMVAAALAGGVCAVGIPAATVVARSLGRKDPVCGDRRSCRSTCRLIAVPVAWQTLLLGFILFRGFDIVKPPPMRQLERLHGGLGIVVDDVAAGLYALVVMQMLLRIRFCRADRAGYGNSWESLIVCWARKT